MTLSRRLWVCELARAAPDAALDCDLSLRESKSTARLGPEPDWDRSGGFGAGATHTHTHAHTHTHTHTLPGVLGKAC